VIFRTLLSAGFLELQILMDKLKNPYNHWGVGSVVFKPALLWTFQQAGLV